MAEQKKAIIREVWMVLSHKTAGSQNGNARHFQAKISSTRLTRNADHISYSQKLTQLWNLSHNAIVVALSVHQGRPAKEHQ